MKKSNLQLSLIQLMVAIGAIPAGYLFLIAPDGSKMGMTIDALSGSPFKDFFIPGIFLFTVNGIFNLAASVLSFKNQRYAPVAGVGLGLSLLIWVSVQVYSIGLSHFLQPLYFIIGIFEIILSVWILRGNKLK